MRSKAFAGAAGKSLSTFIRFGVKRTSVNKIERILGANGMGKVFFTKDKHNILNFVVIGAICLIGYGVIYWLQSMVTYQSDDYYYATFWRDGLLHFIQNSIDHFQGYNGRVLVHFVAQTVLAFDLHVYAVLNTILLFSLAILGCYVIGVSRFRRKERFLCVGIFAVFLFLLGRDVWRDSLLWISASYNYMFPVFLFFLSLFVQTRYLSCKNHCPAATILLIAVNFFAGATTEQCGIMMLLASFIVFSYAVISKKIKWKQALIAPCMNFLGLMTIFLSPATRLRAERSGSFSFSLESIMEGLQNVSEVFMAWSGLFIVIVGFCFASSLLYFLCSKKNRFPLLGIPFGCILVILFLIGWNFWGFLLFSAYLIVLSFFCMLRLGRWLLGAVLIAGIGSAYVMITTNSFVPRIALPLGLILCLFMAVLFTEWLVLIREKGFEKKATALLGSCCLFCILMIVPTVHGYQKNYEIIQKNDAAITESRKTGVLSYCIDGDPNYCHNMIQNDGYSFSSFIDFYGLENCKIYLVSDRMKPIEIHGQRLTSPAYVEDGTIYFPLREITESFGGSIQQSFHGITILLNGVTAEFSGNALFIGDGADIGESIDVSDKMPKTYYATCFTRDIFENVFQLRMIEEEGKYIIEK